MRTAFFASDAIALGAIETLRASREFPLACVVSNPDRPKGRGKKLSPNEVSQWAIDNNVELLRPERPDASTVSRLRELGVELIVVMAYGHILGEDILEYGEYPCLNLHGSILPKYRGASPIESAIALGETETGVSLMKIVKRMDAGPVCDVEKISISPDDTAETLRAKFREASPILLDRNLEAIKNKTAKFIEQDESLATYTRKLDKRDACADFSVSAKTISDRARAFGYISFERGGEILKARGASCEFFNRKLGECGEVLEASRNGLRVACADGAVRFASLQRPCAKAMSAGDFFAGYEIRIGEILKSVPLTEILRRA
ncbi:MAG: methionyl-tRNA formyltransferase [Opitutales bacterium]|nr:methionyl-tRNA formyltransferase [Opitutales bacterium]